TEPAQVLSACRRQRAARLPHALRRTERRGGDAVPDPGRLPVGGRGGGEGHPGQAEFMPALDVLRRSDGVLPAAAGSAARAGRQVRPGPLSPGGVGTRHAAGEVPARGGRRAAEEAALTRPWRERGSQPAGSIVIDDLDVLAAVGLPVPGQVLGERRQAELLAKLVYLLAILEWPDYQLALAVGEDVMAAALALPRDDPVAVVQPGPGFRVEAAGLDLPLDLAHRRQHQGKVMRVHRDQVGGVRCRVPEAA